jgi:hypothetical protein
MRADPMSQQDFVNEAGLTTGESTVEDEVMKVIISSVA